MTRHDAFDPGRRVAVAVRVCCSATPRAGTAQPTGGRPLDRQTPHPTSRCSRPRATASRATTTWSTPSGEDVSIGASWRGTMMANSARDPYCPGQRAARDDRSPDACRRIEDECAACHMPTAQKIAHAAGGRASVFAHLPIARHGRPTAARCIWPSTACRARSAIRSRPIGSARARASTATSSSPPPRPTAGARAFGPFDVDAGRRRSCTR